MRLDCAHNTLTILEYAIVTTMGGRGPCNHFKRELTLHYDLQKLLHLKSDFET
jgi:hypothetical protein